MAEYIECETALKIIDNYSKTVNKDGQAIVKAVRDIVDFICPKADVQEVRHGKWIEKPYLLGTSNFCSLCGKNYGMPHGKYNFCPHCGAKMDMNKE